MTGKVLWHSTMSLDGHIGAADDSMDWLFEITDRSEVAAAVHHRIGAILSGRRTHDGLDTPDYQPYGGAWSGPIFVLTHRPADDPSATFLTGSIEEAVATALDAAGGKDVVLFGASIMRQCLRAGLVDEILVHVVPVLLGEGVRFLDDPGMERVRLEKIECAESGGITDLRFRPVRRPAPAAPTPTV